MIAECLPGFGGWRCGSEKEIRDWDRNPSSLLYVLFMSSRDVKLLFFCLFQSWITWVITFGKHFRHFVLMQQLIRQCKETLRSLGFDLFVPFSGIGRIISSWSVVQHYNSLVQKRFQVSDYGRENTLAILIGAFPTPFSFLGNTRNLWTPFIKHLCEIDYQCDQDPNPLDSYLMLLFYSFV